MNVSADKALPFYRMLAFPDRSVLDLMDVALESAAVVHLHGGYSAEMRGYIIETFFLGDFGGLGIEFVTFALFLLSGDLQVFESGTDYTCVLFSGDLNLSSFKHLEEDLGMVHFIISRFLKNFLNREILFFLGSLCVEHIARVSRRFGYVGSYEELFGLCAFDAFLCHSSVVFLSVNNKRLTYKKVYHRLNHKKDTAPFRSEDLERSRYEICMSDYVLFPSG